MNADKSILLAKDEIMVRTFKETMEVNKMSIRKMIKEKEPSFNKLDLPTKHLILNASTINPFDESAASPLSFTKYFFKQKAIGKAKTALEQHLLICCGHICSNMVCAQVCGCVEFFAMIPADKACVCMHVHAFHTCHIT